MKIKVIDAPEKIRTIVALRNDCGLNVSLKEGKDIAEGKVYELPMGIDPYVFIITLTATGATIATDLTMRTAELDIRENWLRDKLIAIASKLSAIKALRTQATGRHNEILGNTGVQL